MTTKINITVVLGNYCVRDEDKDRAETAAFAVLGNVDPAVAYAEYQRQFGELDGVDGMTGLAALWEKAESAANVALTEGWHNPNGGACTISA